MSAFETENELSQYEPSKNSLNFLSERLESMDDEDFGWINRQLNLQTDRIRDLEVVLTDRIKVLEARLVEKACSCNRGKVES